MWKTDDNSLPPPTGLKTRIWAVEITLGPGTAVSQVWEPAIHFPDLCGRENCISTEKEAAVCSVLNQMTMSEIARAVLQIGQPKEIMDSTGLWWVDSWVAGGSLVEVCIDRHNSPAVGGLPSVSYS